MNVDYVVVRSTAHNMGPKTIASYNIMCQWATHLQKWLKVFTLPMAQQLNDNIVAQVVPKFHLAVHKPECRANFSLNFEPGAGRKDMEGPEWTWFGLQGGGSTKDQGPGFWSDTMDDKFSHWNWTKLVRLGDTGGRGGLTWQANWEFFESFWTIYSQFTHHFDLDGISGHTESKFWKNPSKNPVSHWLIKLSINPVGSFSMCPASAWATH